MWCSVRRCWMTVLIIVAVAGTSWATGSTDGDTLPVKDALLAQDWRRVSALVGSARPSDTVTQQFLRGHAALALNRNDESTRNFLGVSNAEAVAEWEKWTVQFLQRNPNSSLAWFLRGDASARHQDWNEAVKAFSRAVELNQKNALAWNARGVVYALKGRWQEAQEDFDRAIYSDIKLADAYANRGVTYVLRSVGRRDALPTTFGEAIRLSKEFRLAQIGKACLQFGTGDWQDASTALRTQAKTKDPIGAVAAQNLAVVEYSERELLVQSTDADLLAGTSVTTESKLREAPSAASKLNDKILSSELAAIGGETFSHWAKDSKTAMVGLNLVPPARASGLPSVMAGVLEVSGRVTEAFAASQRAQAEKDKAEFRADRLERVVANYKNYPTAVGSNTALANVLKSSDRTEVYDLAIKRGVPSAALERLSKPSEQSQAGGAILNFQRTYTSKGNWGMYVPFGLVYTGIDWRSTTPLGENGRNDTTRIPRSTN